METKESKETKAQSAVAEFSGKLPAGISLVGKGDFKQEGGIGYLELGAEAYLRCSHALKPGQGRQYVNAYTIVLDVKLNSLAEWTAVYQTNTNNDNDAELYVNLSGNVGVLSKYGNSSGDKGGLSKGHWHRIVVSVDCWGLGSMLVFIDGKLHTTISEPSSLSRDGRFSLDQSQLLLFAAKNPKEMPGGICVRSFALLPVFVNEQTISNVPAAVGEFGKFFALPAAASTASGSAGASSKATFTAPAGSDTCSSILNEYRSKATCQFLFAEADGKAIVDRICAELKKSGKRFTDVDFPPTESSLNRRPADEKAVVGVGTEWVRAPDFLPAPTLFDGDICAEDINQGSLGDCWLCGGIAAVGTRPDIVKQLFYPAAYNPAGIYGVRVYRRGVWHWLLLDDHFPVYSGYEVKGQKGFPPFIHGKNPNELWAMFLEKAFAKVFRSYQDLVPVTSMSAEPMTVFTGGKLHIYVPKEHDKLFAKVKYYMDNKWIAKCGTQHTDAKYGLVQGHEYTLLSVLEMKSKGELVQLFKLRNTWGRFEWKGKWADSDAAWDNHPDVKAVAKPDGRDDGVFWMSLDDFYTHFGGGVHLCRVPGGSGAKPADEDAMSEEYCWSDEPEAYAGVEQFQITTTIEGKWAPSNATIGTLSSSTQPQFAFVPKGAVTVRVRISCDRYGGYPWLLVCSRPESSTGAGRVHDLDKEARHVLGTSPFEERFDCALPATTPDKPYVLVPTKHLVNPNGSQSFKVDVKCNQKLDFKALPATPIVKAAAVLQPATKLMAGPQFLLTAEADTTAQVTLWVVDSKFDMWSQDRPMASLLVWESKERVREYAAPLRSGSCQGRQTMSLSIQLRAGTSYVLMPDERNSKSQTPIEISVCTDSVKCSLKEL